MVVGAPFFRHFRILQHLKFVLDIVEVGWEVMTLIETTTNAISDGLDGYRWSPGGVRYKFDAFALAQATN